MKNRINDVRTLAKPLFLEGAETVFVAHFDDRLYVGKIPAEVVKSSDEKPVNTEVSAAELAELTAYP